MAINGGGNAADNSLIKSIADSGLSPIEAAASAIDLHNAAARWNKALLDNSARPSGALVYSNGQHMTAEQFERLKSELEASFQGARNMACTPPA